VENAPNGQKIQGFRCFRSPSHGRGHRFNPCRAHYHFRRKAAFSPTGAHRDWTLAEGNEAFARSKACTIRALAHAPSPSLETILGSSEWAIYNGSNMETSIQTVELFCGKKGFSLIAQSLGYDTFTLDNNPNFSPNLTADIRSVEASQFPPTPLIVWASPPDAPEFHDPESWDKDGSFSSINPAAENAMAFTEAQSHSSRK
jgi:hypothetical protein